MSNIKHKEVHIKLPKEQYDFIEKFKKEFKVSITDFIIVAVEKEIINLKK